MSVILELKCSKHPTYKAKLKPRCKCKTCLDLYNFINDIRNNQISVWGYDSLETKIKIIEHEAG